jgi:hypothetical protein
MKHLFLLLLLGTLGLPVVRAQTVPKYTLSGYVRERGSGELLPGVTVYLPERRVGTTTNNYGFYSLTLPAGENLTVTVSSIGFRTERQVLDLTANRELNIDLVPEGQTLGEVTVSAERERAKVSESVQMSSVSVPIQQIKEIPALLGEKDVLKVLQLLPGVQKGSEGNAGLYVRGGGPDQNLIILDDAPVYNTFHLFGFFSLFNGDALKSVELTKGGFPARFGGRLSSVIEMQMKDGNKEKLHGEGGIGLISSRLTLEGPLVKGKSSFLVSARRTYLDVLVRPFLKPEDGVGGYYFYDLNAKLNYDFGQKNRLYLSGYFGKDKFYFRQKEDRYETSGGLLWGNATGTLRWNHLFNEKLFANTSLIFSNYDFDVASGDKQTETSGEVREYTLRYNSGIRDWTLKTDFDWLPSPKHSIKAGFVATAHRFTPSAIVVRDTDINQFERTANPVDGVEMGLYAEDTYHPIPALRVNAGLRLSQFAADGKFYWRPEPRLGVSYTLPRDWALKASYATMNQYIHLLSNSGIGLPTDLWVPTTGRIAPQQSRQVALGVAKDLPKRNLTLTVEGFYKKMDNLIAFREGSNFLLFDEGPEGIVREQQQGRTWEQQITAGQGWSYGAEFLIQKKVGKFSGWAGYTLSWIQQQFDELNFGKKFWARYDRRHDVSLVGIWRISRRTTLSGTWVYGTGQALTLPQSTFFAQPRSLSPNVAGSGYYSYFQDVSDYGERNSFRAASYQRFDLSLQLRGQLKRHERIWEFSIYNVYNRRNPFFYYTDQADANPDPQVYQPENRLKQVSIFPIVPSVSYTFKF